MAVGHPHGVPTLEATTALPYDSRERAAAGLRAQLRLQAVDQGLIVDWTSFDVTGPTTAPDAQGRPWFEYRGTVATD